MSAERAVTRKMLGWLVLHGFHRHYRTDVEHRAAGAQPLDKVPRRRK